MAYSWDIKLAGRERTVPEKVRERERELAQIQLRRETGILNNWLLLKTAYK